MKLSETVKPISYLKAHASEILRKINEDRQTLVITHNGEAKAVVQDIGSYEQTQESLALLKIIAQSSKSLAEGNYKPLKESFKNIKTKINQLS